MNAPASRCLAAALAAALCLAPLRSSAQQPPPPPNPGGPAPLGTEVIKEATARYQRGARLYLDGDFKLALIEFQRSYEIAPNYKVLYNIAQVNYQLNNYSASRRAFEKYLADGDKEIPAKRRAEVEKDLAALRYRTAHIQVVANVEGAQVTIDGVPFGTTPLPDKLLLDAGQHQVAASRDGYLGVTRNLTLAGADDVKVELELQEKKELPAPPLVPTSPAAAPSPTTAATPPPPPLDAPTPEHRSSNVWIGWVATGVLTAGAAAVGVAALVTQSDLDEMKENEVDAGDDIESTASRGQALAITTDVLAGAALLVGGVTLYFTLASDSKPAGPTGSGSLRLNLAPGHARVVGTF